MDKEDVRYIYICNGLLPIHEKNEILPFNNMDGPRDYHTKWSQKEKDNYHMISLIRGILKRWYKWTYLQNKNRPIDTENKFTVPKRDNREDK